MRNSLLILLLGVVLGALSKWADFHSPWLSELTSGVQLWIFLGCILALYSRTPRRAALHVFLLLGGMVGAYYVTALIMRGVWAKSFVIGWGIAAVLSAVPGYLLWYARGGAGGRGCYAVAYWWYKLRLCSYCPAACIFWTS